MACNENVIKNMSNEITRDCLANSVWIEPEFGIYLVELFLLNPKYGKLFSKNLERKNLQYFVEECVNVILRDETSLSTLKMQFIIKFNYDKISALINRHTDSIANCLHPVLNEILEEEPDDTDAVQLAKMFRKISLYIILFSGLGSPTNIVTIKEGIAALESVFSIEDLKNLVSLCREEKAVELSELVEVVSGVRLFNRDCNEGGEDIPNLPYNLVDLGKTCINCLSNSLMCVMQRVNTLTTAIENAIIVQDETGNVEVSPFSPNLTLDNYKQIFALLAFNRQYEVLLRMLLLDVELIVKKGTRSVMKYREVLEELHQTVKYKAAVPVVTVFPLFGKIWRAWRSMQNVMYVITRVTQLMDALSTIYEQLLIPDQVVEYMLHGRRVMTDQDRMNCIVSKEDSKILIAIANYVPCLDSYYIGMKDQNVAFMGFCAMCLTVGALVPSNMRLGSIKIDYRRFSFCTMRMAVQFSKDPQRYINEILEYARNNPEIINLLNIGPEVIQVKDIKCLVNVKYVAKTIVSDKDIQTETHPIENHIDKNCIWDIWEWKQRACQWASIINCQTHSTQTNYSHLRSEIHCQTNEMRDKSLQTKKDAGMNTMSNNVFRWGLRGQLGDNQHVMDLGDKSISERKKAHVISVCTWPYIGLNDLFRANE